jgi:spore germination protein
MKQLQIITIFFLIFLSGCVEKEILDDISLEIGRGYDRGKDDTIEGTTLIYNFLPDKSVENITVSTTARTTRELMNKLQRQASNPIAEGSLEVFLFSKELASDGLIDYLDAPQRNPSIGARLFIAVVDGSTKELLNADFGVRGNAMFLSDLLTHNIKREDLPRSNLHLFFHDYYQLGKTSFMPEIKMLNDQTLELTGVSLFKPGKLELVDTVEKDKMFFLKLLVDKYSEGSHTVDIGEDEAVVRNISSKNIKKLVKKNPYQINIRIKMDGIITEHTGKRLTPATIKQVEKLMEEEVTKGCEALIKRFQEKGVDPVGLGNFIHTRDRKAKITDDWVNSDEYKALKVKVIPEITIMESGVTE